MYRSCLRVVVVISTLSGLLLAACRKDLDMPAPPAAAAPQPVHVTLQLSTTPVGKAVPGNFLGFSFEAAALTDSSYFNTANPIFIRLIKNLGNGVIRIGGNSVDRILWAPRLRNGSVTRDTIFSDDIDRFASFAHATGWKVIFGLNLGHCDAQVDADEAKYVSEKLGRNMYTFEIGNEPDIYMKNGLRAPNYNYHNFSDNFKVYFNTIRATVPSALFSGPNTSVQVPWVSSFAASQGRNINLLAAHYYRMGPAGNPSVTMDKLLTFDNNLPQQIQTMTSAAAKINVPFRISECNSVYGGGQKGVSDIFASALWGAEYMFFLAENNVAGLNFHGGQNFRYTAINSQGTTFKASPLYYSMLLFREAHVKQFLNAILSANVQKLDAFYFNRTDGKKAVLVINKDGYNDTELLIKTGEGFNSATVHELIAPSLTSTDDISLDGAAVGSDGEWSPLSVKSISATNNSFRLRVKAGSAALLVLN